MNNSGFNIITAALFFKNIHSYQYDSIIEVNEKKYSEFIYKDLLKEFYRKLVDNDVYINEESHYRSDIISKSTDYSYIIIDRDDLKSFFKTYELFILYLMQLVSFLDINDADKFDVIYSFVNVIGIANNDKEGAFFEIDYIIKLKNIARNLRSNPILEDNLEEQMMWFEDYDYSRISI